MAWLMRVLRRPQGDEDTHFLDIDQAPAAWPL